MNLFKIFKKKVKKAYDYDCLTLELFNKIYEIANGKSNTKDFEIMRLLYGEEKGDLSFLRATKIPYKKYRKIYTINKTKYILKADLTLFSTSLYIDYANGKEMIDFLKVVLIPNGHKYNDGYDMAKAEQDLLLMAMTDVNSILVFLVRQFQALLLIIQDYLLNENPEKLSKMNISPEDMKKISLFATESLTIVMEYAKNLI